MKTLLTIASFLVLGAVTQGQDNNRKPYLVKSLSAEKINASKLETSGGNISVAGVESEQRLEVYLYPSNGRDRDISNEELKKRLDRDYDLTIEVNNGKLTAIAKHKGRNYDWRDGVSVSFKLFAPKSVSNSLTTSGGNISLENISDGKQDFRTSGGNLVVRSVSAEIDGRTSGGNIQMSDCSKEIDLSTSGGNIVAEKSNGNMKLSTSGGNLQLNTLEGKIKATTSGGNVSGELITGELATSTSGGNVSLNDLRCSVDASTSGGHLSVNITTLGSYVKLDNSGGNIDLQIPQGKGVNLNLRGDKIRTSNGSLSNFSGDTDDHSLKGTLNGGGVPVDVRASSGRINLSVK